MGYVDLFVKSGLTVMEEKHITQMVEKARTVRAIDSVFEKISSHGPELVVTLDRKVEQTLEGVNNGKIQVIDQYNEKKAQVLETANKKKAQVLDQVNETKKVFGQYNETKTQVLETAKGKVFAKLDLATQKKQEYMDRAYESVQQTKDDVKKAELVQKFLKRTQDTRAAQAAQYLVLMADIAIVKGDSIVRMGLALPQTLKERMEGHSLEEAREHVLDFGREKIYRPLSVYSNSVAVFVVNGKDQLGAFAAERMVTRELLLSKTKDAARCGKQRFTELMQNPYMAQMNDYVVRLVNTTEAKTLFEKCSTQALVLKEKALALNTQFGEKYGVLLAIFSGKHKDVLLVFVNVRREVEKNAALAKERSTAVYEQAAGKVTELKSSLKSHTE